MSICAKECVPRANLQNRQFFCLSINLDHLVDLFSKLVSWPITPRKCDICATQIICNILGQSPYENVTYVQEK